MVYDIRVTVEKVHIQYPNRSDHTPMLANIALLAVTFILIYSVGNTESTLLAV